MLLTNEQYERVRDELRRQLADMHHSRIGLADQLGVSQATVSQVLNGRNGVGMKLLAAMSSRTGKPIDEILGKQAPDLAEENDNLRDELEHEKKRNAELSKALSELLAIGEKHEGTLREYGDSPVRRRFRRR